MNENIDVDQDDDEPSLSLSIGPNDLSVDLEGDDAGSQQPGDEASHDSHVAGDHYSEGGEDEMTEEYSDCELEQERVTQDRMDSLLEALVRTKSEAELVEVHASMAERSQELAARLLYVKAKYEQRQAEKSMAK